MGATVLDLAALDEVLYGVAGPVMVHTVLVAEAVRDVAAGLIHTSPEPHKDGSQHLAETGHVVVSRGHAEVVFDAPYAAAVERGAAPRIIRARNAKVLSFAWPRVGPGTFFFAQTNWPGFPGQHYLTRAAEIIRSSPLV